MFDEPFDHILFNRDPKRFKWMMDYLHPDEDAGSLKHAA